MDRSVGYDTSRYQDNAYEQYPTQSFSAQSVDKFAQLNQQSFAANNAVAQYMPPSVSVLSCQPTTGNAGSKIYLKISSAYDLFPISSPMPYINVVFGSEKCAAQDMARDSQEGQGYFYSCNAEVPQLLVTGCTGSNVPLALLIEGQSGEEIARISAGSFQYVEGSADDITRTAKIPKHDTAPPGTQVDQASPPTKPEEPQLSTEAPTNTYEYPSQPPQYNQQYQGNNDMLTAYRTTSFTEPGFHRRPGPAWNFGGPLGSTGRSPALDHTLAGRSSLTPLPMPSSTSSGTPQLVRTSIAQNAGGYASGYFPSKASLKLNGKLDSMTENWTQEEWSERRRLVVFRKSQSGSTLHASFRPVSPSERPQGSTCVSCIWWAEKRECYVTSVDTIYLLEQLVAAPNKFTVEEKNRIRRNLEGYHPLTVSKGKAESEEFFKLIMAFPHPKPRNIEKDVKVFPWKVLESALKKIIGKYCASPSSLMPPTSSMPPQPPQHPPSTGGYAPLPTPPAAQTLNSQHGDPHGPYAVHPGQHDNIPSPRSLPGSQGPWGPYSAAPSYPSVARANSPHTRYSSPQQPSLRLTTAPLPAVTSYDTRTVTTAGYGSTGLHTPVSHHPSTATPPRWEPTPATYSEGYPSLSGHHGPSAQPVYNTSGYSDSGPRA